MSLFILLPKSFQILLTAVKLMVKGNEFRIGVLRIAENETFLLLFICFGLEKAG